MLFSHILFIADNRQLKPKKKGRPIGTLDLLWMPEDFESQMDSDNDNPSRSVKVSCTKYRVHGSLQGNKDSRECNITVLSQEYVTVLVSLGANKAGHSMDAANSAFIRARHVLSSSPGKFAQ